MSNQEKSDDELLDRLIFGDVGVSARTACWLRRKDVWTHEGLNRDHLPRL